jgi:hypothetical protein
MKGTIPDYLAELPDSANIGKADILQIFNLTDAKYRAAIRDGTLVRPKGYFRRGHKDVGNLQRGVKFTIGDVYDNRFRRPLWSLGEVRHYLRDADNCEKTGAVV